jgi:WD40 repeat protein
MSKKRDAQLVGRKENGPNLNFFFFFFFFSNFFVVEMRAANDCSAVPISVTSAPSPVRSNSLASCDHLHRSDEQIDYQVAVSPGPQHVPFTHVHSLQDEEKSPVFSLATFTWKGKEFLVSSCDQTGRIDVWDLGFFSRFCALVGHSRQVTAVAVAVDSDGCRLFSAARDGIRCWSLETRDSTMVSASYRGAVYCLCATNGWLLSGGQDTFIHAYSPGTNKERVLRGHSGFVFALCAWGEKFFSAGGNGDIFLWEKMEVEQGEVSWQITRKLVGHTGSVMSLAVDKESLFSVSRDGSLKIWDLETFLLARSLVTKKRSEMVAVSVTANVVFAASSSGVSAWVKPSLTYLGALRSDSQSPVSLASNASGMMLFVAGSEGDIGVWQHDRMVEEAKSAPSPRHPPSSGPISMDFVSSLLAQFVGFRTVSGVPALQSDCFNGAKWLRNCFVKLGFDARLEQPSDESVNPIVYARIGDNPAARTVVMYAHYDVVSAGVGWATDPWVLRGLNGYLYGRGTTDNKGYMSLLLIIIMLRIIKRTLACCHARGCFACCLWSSDLQRALSCRGRRRKRFFWCCGERCSQYGLFWTCRSSPHFKQLLDWRRFVDLGGGESVLKS